MAGKSFNTLAKLKNNNIYNAIILILVMLLFYFLPIGGLFVKIISIAIIFGITWLERQKLLSGSFDTPHNWWKVIGGAVVKAIGFLLLSFLLTKLIVALGGPSPDHSKFSRITGNTQLYLIYLTLIWTTVAFGEEIIFRGFPMNRLRKILGDDTIAIVANVFITSIIFGLGHFYQGITGVITTTFVGLLLAINYVYKDYNLWENIFIHGFIDTISITMIFLGINLY